VQEVLILPDADDAGQAHAETVAASCAAAGLRVKVGHFPGRAQGADVSDWLDQNPTSDLTALCQDWKGVPHATTEDVPAGDRDPALGHRADAEAPRGATAARAAVTRLSIVHAESMTWLWPGRIPVGKLTLIFGDPEAGKSFVSLDLAARVTRGSSFPDGAPAPQGSVVLLAAEDGLADTVRPRLDALNGDASRVLVVQSVGARALDLGQDLGELARVIEHEPGTQLVVIDPLSGYIGRKLDTWRDNQVRAVLEPLAALAARTSVAILGLMHMTKAEQLRALARIVGSGAFGAVARAAYLVAPEPESGRRLFACAKLSIGPKPPALAFTIEDLGDYRGRPVWDAKPVPLDADQVLAMVNGSTGEDRDAGAFLREILASGPRLSQDVFGLGRDNGYSEGALKRAKKRAGVVSEKPGFTDAWVWRLGAQKERVDAA
jgi:putative DNA primase/helicase